jgi:CRISPR-associated protein Csb1
LRGREQENEQGEESEVMNEAGSLKFEQLKAAVAGSAIALRRTRQFQPAGGPGDKVFPPTYEGGKYALEERIVGGQKVPCVLLDSVQSQANRMEQALKAAFYRPGDKTAGIPIVAVDFPGEGLTDVGWITSLDAPHRIADAILRDSLVGGKKFRESDHGRAFTNATAQDATALFGLCPTALLLGMWDSTGPKGGQGTKVQRAMVSEIVGIDAVVGKKTSSRIDPLQIQLNAGPLFEATDGGWTLEEKEAKQDKGKGVKLGKDGKPSEAVHGNVMPSVTDGGVTIAHAVQTTVISLAALRRLHFPVEGKLRDVEAQAVLAALGLCAATLTEADMDLRSRCLLVPTEKARWEIVDATGEATPFALGIEEAKSLLAGAVAAATKSGLPWQKDVLVLTPSRPLVELVKRSRSLQMAKPAGE